MIHTLCFTGHRPKQLGGYSGVNANRIKTELLLLLTTLVARASTGGYGTFISGGALGTDQIAMEAVLAVRNTVQHSHIKLVVMRPFPNMHAKWPEFSQVWFFKLLKMADEVIDCYEDPYAPYKMFGRNRAMVDKSRSVIAVWDGMEKGGTWNCLQYAMEKGRHIYHINPTTVPITGQWF